MKSTNDNFELDDFKPQFGFDGQANFDLEFETNNRKISHRKINIIVHDNGEICSQTYNRRCPHEDAEGEGGGHFSQSFGDMSGLPPDVFAAFGDFNGLNKPKMPFMQDPSWMFNSDFQNSFFPDGNVQDFNEMMKAAVGGGGMGKEGFNKDFLGFAPHAMGFGMGQGMGHGMVPGMGHDRGGFNTQMVAPAIPMQQYLEEVAKKRKEQQIKDIQALQDELRKVKMEQRKMQENKEDIMSRARYMQMRASNSRGERGPIVHDRLREEIYKTNSLNQICNDLREELDQQNIKRLESLEIKMKPIIVRDGPSVKANYKIQCAKIQYDIFSLSQRLKLTTIRCEHEENNSATIAEEVRRLREKISSLKIQISTITKGIPMSKIDLRDDVKKKQETSPVPESRLNAYLEQIPKSPEKFRMPMIPKSEQSNASIILT